VPAEDDSSSSSGSSRQNLEDTDGLMQRQQDLQVRLVIMNSNTLGLFVDHNAAADSN
jgi:hypothetical protein